MKKFLSIFSACLLSLLAFSCVNEEFATFDETKATAPVLGSYELGEKALTGSYTPGAFNMGFNDKMPVNHSLILASVDGKTVNKALSASFKDTEFSVSINNIAKALVALGYQEGAVVSLDMFIRASMQGTSQDNGRNGHVDSQGHITISGFEVIIPVVQGNPWEEFTEKSKWSLIGKIASTSNDWTKDEPVYMTPDGTKHVAKNIKLTPDDQFKFRFDAKWDDNRGAPGDVEPYVMNAGDEVEATPNGKNLGVAAEGNYDILYDASSETITITEAYQTYPGFDEKSKWSVIGKIASVSGMDWNKDISMTTDGEWHVCEGVTLTTADQFKFRFDQKWDTNMGAPGDTEPFVVSIDEEQTGTNGGKNLSVPEDGVYDLLCNPEAGLYKIVVSLGGHSPLVGEGGGDEPEGDDKAKVWSIVGVFGGSHWDKDVDLTNTEGDIWVLKNQPFAAGDEFKIRSDHDWDSKFGNYGGPEENSTSTAEEGNPYGVYLPELGTAFAAGGKNIQIIEDGNYDITFDLAAMTIKVEVSVRADWYYHGQSESDAWGELPFEKVSDTEYTLALTTAVANAGFVLKSGALGEETLWIGADNSQELTDGKFVVTVGQEFKISDKKVDGVIAEPGKYVFTFNPQTMTAVLKSFRADWYYHGQSELTPDWGELPFEKVSDTEYVLELKTVSENSEFVLKNGALGEETLWIGADNTQELTDGKFVVTVGKEFKISDQKVNGVIPNPGEYKFIFNPVTMTGLIKNAREDWYYHGQSELTPDWGELPFEKVSDTEYVLKLKTISANSGFVLKNGVVGDNTTWIGPDNSQELTDGKFVVTIGQEFKISGDKVDGVIATPGEYIFTFNPQTMTAVITSVRADWYYHGQSELTPDWGELPFDKVSDTEYVLKLKTDADNYEFVLKNGALDGTTWLGPDSAQEQTEGKFVVKIGEEFKISGEKVNGVIPKAGDYVFTFNPVAMTAVITSVRADWYYHGQSKENPNWGETPFVKVSDDEYYVILDVDDNSEFVLKNGVLEGTSWIGADATLAGEDGKYTVTPGFEFAISDSKVNGVIAKGGKYKLTFYPNEMKAVFATAEPEYFYHGQSKRTPNWGTVPFEKVSDSEYYVILEVEAGYGFVLKTADESSWFGAAASGKGEDGKFHVVLGTEFSIDGDKVDAVFDAAGLVKLTYNPKTQKAVVTAL